MKEKLKINIESVERICVLIDNGERYLEEVLAYFPQINEVISDILNSCRIEEQFVAQVLKDLVYGVEQDDEVVLKDTLKYGLLQIYQYAHECYQNGECYE